ncbi:MAG: hypothetical protein HQL95_00325 [Magnetococcales bacterium]|nr:hypothetical protein [Magnetococcales bacterium]
MQQNATSIVSPARFCDTLRVYRNGVLIDQIDDRVTTAGFYWIIERIKGQGNPATHMAVGSGSTAAALADTALVNELGRVALTTPGGVPSGDTITFEAEFPAGVGTGTINEIGLFDAASGGTLISRNVKGPYAKDVGDVLTFTLSIKVQ